jgi:hypothetical protein
MRSASFLRMSVTVSPRERADVLGPAFLPVDVLELIGEDDAAHAQSWRNGFLCSFSGPD